MIMSASKNTKTDLKEHKILAALGDTVLKCGALPNATFSRKPGPSSQVRRIHGVQVAESVSKSRASREHVVLTTIRKQEGS